MRCGLTTPSAGITSFSLYRCYSLRKMSVGCESPSQAHTAQAEGCRVTRGLGEKLWGAMGCR